MTDTYNLASPSVNVTGTGTFALRTAKFGEGYAQDAADGPNNESQSWPLTWTLTSADATALVAFLRAHGQGQTFFWTPPLGVQGYYVVSKYQVRALGAGNYTIDATFDQRFKP